jgi:hypothetical protein
MLRLGRWRLVLVFALALLASVACQLSPAAPSESPEATSPVPGVSASPILTPLAAPGVWIPVPGTSWQWQLTGSPVDLGVEAEVFDLDLYETDAETIAALHARGRKVICYLSAGSWEDWRPDAADFPEDVIGDKYEGWPGERWLDIRRLDLLEPVMAARLRLCRDKGFDAVEPDNIDGYGNDTAFPITYDDQLRYNRWLASEAHALGLSIGLKNDPEQAGDLVSDFDWALTEDCFDQGWCEAMSPFLHAGKAVFVAEYTDTGVDFDRACAELPQSGFSLIMKDRDLTAWRDDCRDGP